jgi:hypothetical protein
MRTYVSLQAYHAEVELGSVLFTCMRTSSSLEMMVQASSAPDNKSNLTDTI